MERPDSPGVKMCPACGKEQPFSEFTVARHRADGRSSRCKRCDHQYYVEHRQKCLDAAKHRAQEKKEEVKDYHRQYYRANCENLRRSAAENYRNNHEAGRAKRREYAGAHKKEALARVRKWRQSNLKYSSRYKRERLESDPEKRERQNECNRKWARANRAITRKASLRRETRIRLASEGAFTNAEWNALLEHYLHRCVACLLQESEIVGGLQADHVIPLQRLAEVPFGPLTKQMVELNLITNIQPLCRACNLKKGTKDTDYRTTFWTPLD